MTGPSASTRKPAKKCAPSGAPWWPIVLRKISVIGDRFMLSSMFEEALRERCRLFELDIRTHDMPWPDEPMEHGYAVQGMDGLKEYMGTADQVVELTGDAEILVTQLAPLSASIMDRLPNLKFVAVSRGGPGQHRHEGGARARHHGRQHAGPQCLRRRRIHHRRHPRRDAQDHQGP